MTDFIRDRNQLRRLLAILGRLRRGTSVRDLAETLGVSQKTIRRDLAFLRDAGFALRVAVLPHGKKQYRGVRVIETLKQMMSPDK